MKHRLIREVQGYEQLQFDKEWVLSVHVGTVKLMFPTGSVEKPEPPLLGKTHLILEYETPDAQP